ncbi:hypothetical protein ACH5RR_017277 [Cinchona calisaya]|uniref:CASP-like protein n=1 Tax=Cinchona calisaya TaxID=153742 RepID=A0ABD2ZYQ9_9GENT
MPVNSLVPALSDGSPCNVYFALFCVGYGGNSALKRGAAATKGQNRPSKSSVFLSPLPLVFFLHALVLLQYHSSPVVQVISKLTGIFLLGGGGGGDGDGSEFFKDTAASNAGVAFAVTALAAASVVCKTEINNFFKKMEITATR